MKRIVILGLLLAAGHVTAVPPLRVLFIGNSHTYVHDVPGLVQKISQGTDRPLLVEMRAPPSWSLADHLKDRTLRPRLAEPWDWVVLQQGPSSQPLSRQALIDNAREMARRIKRAQSARRRDAIGTASIADTSASASIRHAGSASRALRGATRIALYSTWPPLPMANVSPEAEESYRLAAQAAHGCMLPVAAAWRTAIQVGEAPPLYSADQLHASRAGAVLAALVIAAALIGTQPPLAVPAGANAQQIARLHSLEHAAARALAAEPLKCAD